jgi:hypothetical protein
MKLFRNLFLLAGLLLAEHLGASAQVFEWTQLARNCGRNGNIGMGATTDAAGNTYACFHFTDSARVGGQLVRHPANVPNGYQIARFDSTGRVMWVKAVRGFNFPIGEAGGVPLNGFKADPVNGGFFVTGTFSSTSRWDGALVPTAASLPTGSTQGFYGKCDANGALLWTRLLPTNVNYLPELTVDGLGNCYLAAVAHPYAAGVPAGNHTIGGMPIDSTEAFLVGNNAAGTGEWVRRLHATPTPPPATRYDARWPAGLAELRLGPQAAGGCMLFGAFNQSLYFGNPSNPPVLSSRTAVNTFDQFILSAGPSGTLSWARPGRLDDTATTPVPTALAAAADQAGNYYLTGTSTLGLSLAKYSAAGALLWATNQLPQNVPIDNNMGIMLAVDAAGEATILAAVDANTTIGNFVLTDYQNIIHFNAAGVPQWVTGSRSAGDATPNVATSDNQGQNLDLDAAGNVYFVSAPNSYSPQTPANPSGNSPIPPTFILGDFTQVGGGSSVARIGTRHNTVRGHLYLDTNGNGVRDNGEGAFPQNVVLQGLQGTRATLGTLDTSGNFNVYVGPGAYTLPAPVPPLHYTLTQPTSSGYGGSFVGYGRVDTARHFGFRPIPNQLDLRATLTAYGAARPGFQARQRLTLTNVGTTAIPAGTATVTLDAQTSFVSSYPSSTSTGRVVRWNYPAIPALSSRTLDVTVQIPASTPLFTRLNTAADASVTGDLIPSDNSSSTTQTVTGSFDPNDITVSYERLSPADVASQLPLDYTIRFQNMGTDTAFTVVVADTLDFRKLDLTTLELLAESHPCTWSVSGTGNLVLRFLNIHLPYKAQNELGSQGFVRFRVVPKTTLALGELVLNKADIFFDYNAPVTTNTAQTAVLLPTALTADARATAFAAYPNPAHSSLTVTAELRTAGSVQLSLLDALGRTVQQQRLAAPAGPLSHTLALSSLRPGIYVLRLTLPDGSSTSQRLVVE